jgi:transcriptional regulator with XRE-family HTH domain
VAERVVALRAARGWSQEELGARAGLTYKFIGEVERGQKSPSLDSLGAIARGFGIDIGELFGDGQAGEAYPPLGEDPLAAVREARDSLDRVLGTSRSWPGRRARAGARPTRRTKRTK